MYIYILQGLVACLWLTNTVTNDLTGGTNINTELVNADLAIKDREATKANHLVVENHARLGPSVITVTCAEQRRPVNTWSEAK
jgi:hypothetical protein